MREGAGLVFMKDGDKEQGGFKCGMTVPGQREDTRFRGDMPGSGISEGRTTADHAGRRGKGRIRDKLSALEEAYGEYRIRIM